MDFQAGSWIGGWMIGEDVRGDVAKFLEFFEEIERVRRVKDSCYCEDCRFLYSSIQTREELKKELALLRRTQTHWTDDLRVEKSPEFQQAMKNWTAGLISKDELRKILEQYPSTITALRHTAVDPGFNFIIGSCAIRPVMGGWNVIEGDKKAYRYTFAEAIDDAVERVKAWLTRGPETT